MIKAIYIRRIVQVAVLAALLAVPYMTQNPRGWAVSRIVQGSIPEPRVFAVSGDTWAFSAWGVEFINPVAFVEAMVTTRTFYVPMFMGALAPLFITLVAGRVFCSWICPAGFLLELNQRLHNAIVGAGRGLGMPDIRYAALGAALVMGLLLSMPVISILDPPHALGRELMYAFTHNAVSVSGVGLLVGILIFDAAFVRRGWCGRICPSGACLGLIGKWRTLRMRLDKGKCTGCGKCDRACPYALGPMDGLGGGAGFDWLKCDNCGLCRDACPEAAITYGTNGRRD